MLLLTAFRPAFRHYRGDRKSLGWTEEMQRPVTGVNGGTASSCALLSSVMRVHGVVRLALNQAVKWGWRSDNPAVLANPGKLRKAKITLPTKGDVLQLLAAAEAKDVELLTFLFLDAETGARRGELAGPRLSDFDDDAVTIARHGADLEGRRLVSRLQGWSAGFSHGSLKDAVAAGRPIEVFRRQDPS